MARDRPSPYGAGMAVSTTVARGPVPRDRSRTVFSRSAGACPPRSFDPRENRTQTKAVSRADLGTARDRPSPYDEGVAFFP